MAESIKEIQDDIIQEFAILDGDMEMTNFYIMELGQKLPPMEEEKKTEENVVKGCQSKVWLTAHLEDSKVKFNADSNTAITKGLVSLLVRVFSDQKPDDIINAELYFPHQIGMDRFIGTQRSNGFAAMIKQMKLYALALKSKIEA
ncbi:Sulfur acceptor protein SufE for iron-sulfur cluster assembly [Fulvivirga imtechensis AK7]|uniref:Sulfur acceptor protein SufE for iron-sulfur cluster assembly n=1 Tax=Fulvivirga imtechensis AK7 TaxID=1237149 RepID=L8JJ84_9BACT|nr:SufE family protein [Fulvivirga imtechensis]ELR68966.1 Sulfur acceptor protein SufE for iron-sulfur cluster assembly [Fulvivirga imtechensis AK7]